MANLVSLLSVNKIFENLVLVGSIPHWYRKEVNIWGGGGKCPWNWDEGRCEYLCGGWGLMGLEFGQMISDETLLKGER